MPTVYCIPGTMCDADLWTDLIPNLVSDITLEHLIIPNEENVNDMVQGLLRQLPEEPCVILGFSLGGYLLSEIARLAPARLKQGIILSNTIGALPESEKQQRLEALNWVSVYGYKGIPLKKTKAMMSSYQANRSDLIERIIAMDKRMGAESFTAQLKATIERRDNSITIQNSGVSWLFMFGMDDSFVNAEQVKKLSAFDNVSICVAPNCGHMLTLERPKWVAEKLSKSISRT